MVATGPEHPNADVVRALYRAMERSDVSTIRSLHADDFVAHVGGDSPVAGDWSGQALADLAATIRTETGGTQRAEPRHIMATDRFVAVIHRWTASRHGRSIDQETLIVYRVHDGKLAERWEFVEDQQAHDDFWSFEPPINE